MFDEYLTFTIRSNWENSGGRTCQSAERKVKIPKKKMATVQTNVYNCKKETLMKLIFTGINNISTRKGGAVNISGHES